MAAVDRNNPKRGAASESTYSLMEFMREFPDDATCLDYLWRENFSADGAHADCPKCGRERKFHRVASRPSWSCDTCGHHVHPTAGTIFHKSPTSLHLWFYAIFMMSSTRCGISAKQLERELGVTYKTAWRMAKMIRDQLMAQDDTPLSGDVEMDETYVGGRPRLKDKRRRADGSFMRGPLGKPKATVFGAVERGGRVRATVVPADDQGGISHRAATFALPSSTVFTDEFSGYDKPGKGYAAHHRINHSQRIYVSGTTHTQTIEGFWSLVKNGIRGVHHSVSAKHLQGYLNGYAWRYNHRDDRRPTFFTLLESAGRPVDPLAAG
jgi:transposase-like protein